MKRLLRLFLRNLVLLCFVAAANASQVALDELHSYRSIWKSAGVSEYEYGYNKFCECHRERPPETLVTVSRSDVVNVRHKPVDSTREVHAETRNFYLYWTIDDLFDLVESALGRDAVVRVDYDSEFGFPRNIYIDYDANLIGDEVDVRITRFTAQSG